MNKLSKIECEKNISLPSIYRHFYELCSISIPANLIGTDLLNNSRNDLNKLAQEILEDDKIENFLERDDFVFMMHQGYIFWYFKADGIPDPFVYSYYEGKLNPKKHGHLSEFLKEFIKNY